MQLVAGLHPARLLDQEDAMHDQEPQQVAVPIDWHVPEDLACQYATNLVVQHTAHEFMISFFRLAPPLIVGTTEEQKAQLEQIGYVRADCVARLIIAPGRMPEFLQVLQANLEAYQARHGRTDEE
jgi:hypothetical protein